MPRKLGVSERPGLSGLSGNRRSAPAVPEEYDAVRGVLVYGKIEGLRQVQPIRQLDTALALSRRIGDAPKKQNCAALAIADGEQDSSSVKECTG